MGTNYYLQINSCPHCGKPDEERHIGKSSMGWKFLFKAEYGYWSSFGEFKDYLKEHKDRWKIFDEYHREHFEKDLLGLIERKQIEKTDEQHSYSDPEGYRFTVHDFS